MPGFSEAVFGLFNIFLAAPWLAFVVGGSFIAAFVMSLRAPRADAVARVSGVCLLGVALPWIVYGIWEMRMQAWSTTVTAPIRVDMACIAPILFGLGALGAVAAVAVLWRVLR